MASLCGALSQSSRKRALCLSHHTLPVLRLLFDWDGPSPFSVLGPYVLEHTPKNRGKELSRCFHEGAFLTSAWQLVPSSSASSLEVWAVLAPP